ncbi:MAG: T9SS type A sorting domain-containing protein [Saprospiraceae bacterium]|nr:T9SS type A sorting domain-containing protein [Saprospiraceae bacterium]
MNHIFPIFLIWSLVLFLSNSSGVPQAVSGAPGEANSKSCTNCHNPGGNFNPTIGLEVMNPDSTLVTTYVPGKNYIVRITVKAENNPKSYGFQMVCLTQNNNQDMGVWSGLGDKVRQRTILARKYLGQSAAKTNGIFTANWKAPDTDKGSINFYIAGLASNQNGNTSGDNNVTGTLTLNSSAISSISENEILSKVSVSPNPARDVLNIAGENISNVRIFSSNGRMELNYNNVQNEINIQTLAHGLYFVIISDVDGNVLSRHKLIKL